MVLNWRWPYNEGVLYIENIRPVSLMAGRKMEGIVKWRGLKSQGPRYMLCVVNEQYVFRVCL